MKPILITLCFCLFAFFSLGQKTTFESGYLVTDTGDTLRGEVKYNKKKEQDCYNKVFFKDASGVQKNYKPSKKITAYGFNDQHFVVMDFENEPKFYKVLARGEINLYKMMFEEISMNQPVLGGEYFVVLQSDEKTLLPVKEGRFKRQMFDLMKDNTEFIKDYIDEKSLNENQAAEVIKKYNHWRASQ